MKSRWRTGIDRLRMRWLVAANRARLRKALQPVSDSGRIPVFFIFTPDIVHFGPYCIATAGEGFEPVLLLNAVSDEDAEWLRERHPRRIMVRLQTSLSGNRQSLLDHGSVLNSLLTCMDRPFCIQDPDCFVIDAGFWDKVAMDAEQQFACGPFTKETTGHGHVLPDTFFLMLNPGMFASIAKRYGISASSIKKLPPAAQQRIERLGYREGQYPEDFKGYFDTLQAFWVLALAEGYGFGRLPGAGKGIFHIGGTSYLHNSDYDLAHWDYWPLSVIYFNLLLLELPQGQRFRRRFQMLFDRYRSAEQLLLAYPEFTRGYRYGEIRQIYSSLVSRR